MQNKLKEVYGFAPIYRVRNAPYNSSKCNSAVNRNNDNGLQIIWHGLSIYYQSRGIHVILEAISKCDNSVMLTLQGNINEEQKNIINEKCKELNISNRVMIKPPAHPDKIVESLYDYDIGVSAELPLEENQILTSSNKLFEYIHAGLAIIASDLTGLAETIQEYQNGILYEAGNSTKLAEAITKLCNNRELLKQLKTRSLETAKNLNWCNDYQPVYNYIMKHASH